MVTVVGNDISISFDSTDYTSKIIEFSAGGGDKIIKYKKMFGNQYKSIITGRSDYEMSLKFKYDIALESVLFVDTPISIVIITGLETITYNNMICKGFIYEMKGDDVAYINLIYTAPARTNDIYNRVVT